MLPMIVMTVSPAISSPQDSESGAGAQELGPQDGLVQAELTVQFLCRGRLRAEGDDGVDALGLLLDVVGQTAFAPQVDVVHSAVVTKDNGTVDNVDLWGKRRLAYDIKKKSEGIYAVVTFSAESATAKELDRQLGLNESILRTKLLRPGA